MAEILDIGEPECPISILSRTPHSDALVTEVLSMKAVKDACGAIPYGADTNQWPGWWYDAVSIAAMEDRRIEIARDKARERG